MASEQAEHLSSQVIQVEETSNSFPPQESRQDKESTANFFPFPHN